MKSIAIVLLGLTTLCFAKVKTPEIMPKPALELMKAYEKLGETKQDLAALQKQTLRIGAKAVPAIVHVMKSDQFHEKKRWVATFSLGKIMGKKSSPYLAKFTRHPHWMLRLAALKTMLAINEKGYGSTYADALKDKSLLVRIQALENIQRLDMKHYSQDVWNMMFHKQNYVGKKGNLKRTQIISRVIKTLGQLDYKKAEKPFLDLIQKEKYQDVFSELDFALSKITGKKSPKGDINAKRKFWKTIGS